MSSLSERIVSSFPDARLATYRAGVSGGAHEVWALHTWNSQIAAATLETLNFVELVLRNTIDVTLRRWNAEKTGCEDWTSDPAAPLNAILHPGERGKLTQSVRAAQRARNHIPNHPRAHTDTTIDDRVASATFGLWARMFPQRNDEENAARCDENMARAVREEVRRREERNAARLRARSVLWSEALHKAFPYLAQDPHGYATGDRVRRLHALRNRASHMENLLSVDVEKRFWDAIQLVNAICPEYRDWLEQASRMRSVNVRRPSL